MELRALKRGPAENILGVNNFGNSGFIVGEKARNGLPFLPVLILSERSSPSRVRFPAPKKRRALDCCGPL